MLEKTTKPRFILTNILLTTALAAAYPALAADAANSDKPAEPADAQLEAVTVTATRRAEPLQSVPIAVSVLKGEQLQQANLNNLATIAAEVPSLTFRESASNKDSSLFIRGVGTISTSPGVEPSVSTVIDGVVLARPGQATLDLMDIDRIEVLRGPQGTLFGKNASAGVINIVSKEPSKDLQRYIDASYFTGGNERRLKAGISGELVPDVALGSLSLLWGDYDGNVTNVYNGEKVNGYNKEGIRGNVVLTPSETLKISLIADYLKSNDTVPNGVVVSNSVTAYPTGIVTPNTAFAAANTGVVASADNRTINNNLKSQVDDKNQGLSAQLDWLLGDYTLTSITAYRTWDNTQVQDGDRLSSVVLGSIAQSHDHGDLAFKQFSQELRVASPKGKFLEYVGGLYYLNTKDDEVYRRDIITTAGVSQNGVANYGTRSTSYSIFGESTLNFTQDFRGIAGLRWTNDDLEYYHQRVSSAATAQPGIRVSNASSGSTSDSAFSGRIGPQFDLTKDVTTYATYSHGYKGPAYNVFFNMDTANGDNLPLKPETSDSFEIGLKSTSFNNRLRANLATFVTKYDNYQANFQDSVAGTAVTRLINAGQVSSRGVELDLKAKVTDRLTLSAAISNIDARIDNFIIPTGLSAAQLAAAQVNGSTLPYSPKWKSNLQANYRFPLNNGFFIDASTEYNWQSKVQFSLTQTPDTVQSAYGIWNASVGLSDPSKGWRLALLVKNIGNQSYSAQLAQGSGVLLSTVPRDAQRYYGLNLRYDF